MTIKVPTANTTKDAAGSGLKAGGVGGLGVVAGKSLLGRGIGTAAGGIVGAAAMTGSDRDRVATYAVMRGMEELFDGPRQSSGGGNNGVM